MVHSSSLHGSLLIVLAILWSPPPPQKKNIYILYWQTAITTRCKSLIGMVTLLVGLVNLEVLITSLVTLKVYQ